MGSLGYVMQVPEEEKYLMTKDELLTRIVTLLGGRAAEEIVFDTVTTGAAKPQIWREPRLHSMVCLINSD